MAAILTASRIRRRRTGRFWPLVAAVLTAGVVLGGVAYAANNSVQGAKKDDNAFDGDAPTAILMEASSGSILFEKNADELWHEDAATYRDLLEKMLRFPKPIIAAPFNPSL